MLHRRTHIALAAATLALASAVITSTASAEGRNVGRQTTPLFGLGLVDSLPDSFFEAQSNLAAPKPAVPKTQPTTKRAMTPKTGRMPYTRLPRNPNL